MERGGRETCLNGIKIGGNIIISWSINQKF